MYPLCPSCARPMVGSKLGRKIFECSTCHEIIQLLEVGEVSPALPWSESYCVDYRGRSWDDTIR
jgi:tRNA(Ile2) C34 agmatinyltransferase TiaS